MELEHPAITMTERTGYPTLVVDNDFPVEDMFGDEIRDGDDYFVLDDDEIVLEENVLRYFKDFTVKKTAGEDF
jgi:hypothetical protein